MASTTDSAASSEYDYDSDEEYQIAQQQWEESVRQLQALLSIVLLPYLGKWLGRKWSHWAYDRYLRGELIFPFLSGWKRV